MKKFSAREMGLVTVLGCVVFGYGFYSFLWTPMKEEEALLLEEKQKVEDTLSSKNVPNLEQEKISLGNESDNLKLALEEIKEVKTFGEMNYQKLLEYLGAQAEQTGVDLTDFEKLEHNDRKAYWEIPYEVTAQGDYDKLINFVNSVYKIENYFYITHMDLREISRIPMTDEAMEGQGELRDRILFEWAPEFLNDLDRDIPSELRAELEEDYLKDFEEVINRMEQEQTRDFDIEEKLQLTFTFHFISLEETKE